MKNSKILWIALPLTLIMLLYAGYDYVYLNVAAYREELSESIHRKERMLNRYVTTIAQKHHIAATLPFLRPMGETAYARLIPDSDPEGASRILAQMLERLVLEKGGELLDVRNAGVGKMGQFNLIEVELEATLPDAKAFQELIYAIDTNDFALMVRGMDIRVAETQNPIDMMVRLRIAALAPGENI